LAKLVGPMITYLLPLLIGYTGGKLMGTVSAVPWSVPSPPWASSSAGTDIPMFMGTP
jgi:PTS system mannitol-specific IIC component